MSWKDDQETSTHPSFGQITFSRVSSNEGNLFYGSELPQDHFIKMEIHGSEVIKDLTSEHYYPTNLLVRARLTSIQFAEMITQLNYGSGVPLTLEYLPGNKIEELPLYESRKELVHRKFKIRMEEFAVELKEKKARAKTLINKKTLSKEDQHELNMLLERLTQEVASNIPFFAKQFQETADRVVAEAKMEVESAILHKVSVLGLNALHNENKLLEGKK